MRLSAAPGSHRWPHPLDDGRDTVSVRSRAAAAVLLLCVVTGCAGGGDSEPKEGSAKAGGPTGPVPPPGDEAKAISVPLDRYSPSPAETEVIRAADDVLTGTCMRRKGLDWKPAPRASEEDAEPRNRRRYGVVEPNIAEIYGYHLPADRPSVAKRSAAIRARDNGLDAAEKKAAYGSGRKLGGCAKKAREALLKDAPDADFDLLNNTLGTTYEQSRKDPAVVRVFRAWSACMKKEGYRYADPMEAITDKRWLKSEHVSRAEIRQARTDVRCKKRTDLVSVWNAAENRIQRKAIKAESAAFKKLAETQRKRMAAAHRVLEKS